MYSRSMEYCRSRFDRKFTLNAEQKKVNNNTNKILMDVNYTMVNFSHVCVLFLSSSWSMVHSESDPRAHTLPKPNLSDSRKTKKDIFPSLTGRLIIPYKNPVHT